METNEVQKQVEQLIEQANTDLQSVINVNTRIVTNTGIMVINTIRSLVQEILNRDGEIASLKDKISRLEKDKDNIPQTVSPS